MAGVGKPALIVRAFAPIGGRAADVAAGHAYLGHLWDACDQLGIRAPLLSSLDVGFPQLPDRDSPAFRLLAGRSLITDERLAQAFLFVRHDVLGFAAALASQSDSDDLSTWARALSDWRTANGDEPVPPQLLGEDLCLVAHVEEAGHLIPPRHEAAVRAGLRAAGLDCWDPAFVTAQGFVVWEWQDAAGRRVVTALAARPAEDALSRWVWWEDERELAPMGRYQLNASKLSYEARVYETSRIRMADLVHQVDDDLGDIFSLNARARGGRGSIQALSEAQRRLADEQADAATLAMELSRLRSLKRTVAIARYNLRLSAPSPDEETPDAEMPMVKRDQDLAAWLEGQIDQDLGYAEAVVQRAREAQAVSQLRLQQSLTEMTRSQNRVTLLQTSLLSALIASLAAINVLHVSLVVPEELKLPVLAAFVTLLLALPALAAHWFERYGTVDRGAAVLFGAALGWLVAVIVFGTSPIASLAGVLLGGVVALALALRHDTWMGGTTPPGERRVDP